MPSWANGGKARERPAAELQRPAQLRVRRRDALQRHVHPEHGRLRRDVPPGREVLARVERAEQPELAASRRPAAASSARGRTRRSARRSTQGVHFTNFAGEKVACGATGPRGNNRPRSSPAVDVADRVHARDEARPAAEPRRLCAPSVLRQAERDADAEARAADAVELGNINTLIAEVNRLWGKKRIWITEYAWQTTRRTASSASRTRARPPM